ncbi:MAG: BrnT family toxin [Candidatus Vecturithrix sp.]|jgi:uncharacterized DUF497 family protein|nr:BrnT family toxin [Candidatus Vecturithrix sp.]
MQTVDFTWDERKHQSNQHKHGVNFEEAKSVFYDEHARLRDDPEHSYHEERSLLLGMSFRFRLLVVCHAFYEEANEIRIISARLATPHEQRQYMEFWT